LLCEQLAKSLILLDSPVAEPEECVAQISKIEWTDVTWNPVAGCTIASAGCSNCYAMRMAARLAAMGTPKYVGLTRKSGGRALWTGKIALDVRSLSAPYKWRKPRKVFVNSMSDLFHPSVPDDFIARVWRVMIETPQHTYQVLTKRPDRMCTLLTTAAFGAAPNIWLGTSVENSDVLSRIEDLRNIPRFIKFISFEPLIGSVGAVDLTDIDWAIVGGESGPRSRPMEPLWVEQIEDRCRAYGTAFFFKQWGGINKKAAGRLLNGRTYDEMPAVAL
jgi:protein gp37